MTAMIKVQDKIIIYKQYSNIDRVRNMFTDMLVIKEAFIVVSY